jgi:hypothetical protein
MANGPTRQAKSTAIGGAFGHVLVRVAASPALFSITTGTPICSPNFLPMMGPLHRRPARGNPTGHGLLDGEVLGVNRRAG